MSFSDISREIRELIFQALLCPQDGVLIQKNYQCTRFDINREAYWKDPNYGCPVAVIPIPTSIFYVNRQINQETTIIFYLCNRFTFDTDADAALKFFNNLRPSSRQQVKHIAFTLYAFNANDADCRHGWEPFCKLIASHMHLESVTIQVPLDTSHPIDETREVRQAPWMEVYWWSAALLMGRLLMAGKIQKLRLGYPATLLETGIPEDENQSTDAAQSPHEDPLEKLDAISCMRHPQPTKEEWDGEFAERVAFIKNAEEGKENVYSSFTALLAEQDKRWQRLDFVVTREYDPVGDVGTVLVLTRPRAAQYYEVD